MKRVMLTRPQRKQGATQLHASPKAISNKAEGNGGGWSPLKGDQPPPIHQSPHEVEKEKKMTVEALLRAASLLTKAERKQLLASLALLAQETKAESQRDPDMWATAVWEALTQALGAWDGAGQGPLVIKRVVAAGSAWAPVADFMASSRLDGLTVTERQAVYRMLAKITVKRAKEISAFNGAPLTPKLVAGVAQNLGALFEREFPGYLASGLALMVARRLVAGSGPAS